MCGDLILMPTALRGSACCEREPPILLGEPTVLNKERTGQSTEVHMHRIGTVRHRSSW